MSNQEFELRASASELSELVGARSRTSIIGCSAQNSYSLQIDTHEARGAL
jgi:hypothetical protein